MKIVVRALSVLAVLALATPAFACEGAKKTTMASSEKAQTSTQKATAKAEKKADAKAKTTQAQQQQVKPASAAN
jgi:hypothetical protein